MSSRGAVWEGVRRLASTRRHRGFVRRLPRVARCISAPGRSGRWLLLALAMPGSLVAQSQAWVARCNGLEFRFDAERKATVSMVTANGLFPLAVGKVHFDNGLARRAALSGLGDGPAMDVGVNRDRKIVYVFRKDPDTGAKEDAVFCATDVRVE